MWFRLAMECSGRSPNLKLPLAAICALVVSACSPNSPGRDDPFTATGEVIALGGGDRGVINACITCHGLAGEGDGAMTPRLAGLSHGYLLKQMQDYADGRRADAVMGPVARGLSMEARVRVADYYAALPAPQTQMSGSAVEDSASAAQLYHQGAPERGLPACAACHGEAGQGVGPGNPPVHGQPAAYLAEQLVRWRDGRRQNDSGRTMLLVSQRLTPAEMADLGAYMTVLAGSPGDRGTAPSPP